MNPPLASPRGSDAAPTAPAPDAPVRRDPPAVRGLGVALFLLGAAAAVACVLTGAPLPPLAPVVLLAGVLAFCVNRYTFFPSELAVTAEAAVVLAAVVAFSGDAPLLGPLVVAGLVGPADMVHWEQRAFSRMAHNAGDRVLAALAAALAFAAVTGGTLEAAPRVALGIVTATVAFAAVEVVLSVVLLRLLGESGWHATVGHAVGLESLTVPLGIAGGVAGVVAIDHGWWVALLVLAPLPWVPELALRRRGAVWSAPVLARVVTATAGVLAASAAVIVTPASDRGAVLVVCVAAAVLGLELAVHRAAPVPVLAALAVLPVVTMTNGSPVAEIGRGAAVALVVVCASATVAGRWWWWSCVAALGGAAAALVGVGADPVGILAITWCGVGAAVVFGVIAAAAARDRRREAARALWTLPVVLAVSAASAIPSNTRVLGVVTIAGTGMTLTSWVAAPPWPSRVLARASRAHLHRLRAAIATATVLAVVAIALATVGVVATARARETAVLGAAATAEVVLAVALVATRQWRFAPASRRRDALLSAAATIGVASLYVRLASLGNGWSLLVMSAALAWALRVLVQVARVATPRPSSRAPIVR